MNDRTIGPAWPAAPAAGWKPALTAGGIHLWLADLDSPPRPLAELAATLAAEGRERAARFRFPEHRDRFIAGRGLLRGLLAAYLDRPAAALRFEQGPHGKPCWPARMLGPACISMGRTAAAGRCTRSRAGKWAWIWSAWYPTVVLVQSDYSTTY